MGLWHGGGPKTDYIDKILDLLDDDDLFDK